MKHQLKILGFKFPIILKFYNIEKNSFYQRHKFWMQINIFDIFDVLMIFFQLYHLKHQLKILGFKFLIILKFYNIEKNSFYQSIKFWMQINIFDIFDVFMIFYSLLYHKNNQLKILGFKFPIILKFYNIEKNSFYQRHKF